MLKNRELRKLKREYKKVKAYICYLIARPHGTYFAMKKCTDLKNMLKDANDKLTRVSKELQDYFNSEGFFQMTDIYSKETFEIGRDVLIKQMGIDDQIRTIEGLKAQS